MKRWRFSLKSLLLLVTLAAVFFGWMGTRVHQAHQERIAIAEIAKSGGVFEYDYAYHEIGKPKTGASPNGHPWLRSLLGDEFFDSPISLYLYNSRNTSTQIPRLWAFRETLRWLSLGGSTVVDAELRHVAQMSELQYLNLRGTGITDNGVKHLEPLIRMKGLDLMGCPVTDTSVPLLARFDSLEYLNVCGTELSQRGITQLHNALSDCDIRSGRVVRVDMKGDATAIRPPLYLYPDGGDVDTP